MRGQAMPRAVASDCKQRLNRRVLTQFTSSNGVKRRTSGARVTTPPLHKNGSNRGTRMRVLCWFSTNTKAMMGGGYLAARSAMYPGVGGGG